MRKPDGHAEEKRAEDCHRSGDARIAESQVERADRRVVPLIERSITPMRCGLGRDPGQADRMARKAT